MTLLVLIARLVPSLNFNNNVAVDSPFRNPAWV